MNQPATRSDRRAHPRVLLNKVRNLVGAAVLFGVLACGGGESANVANGVNGGGPDGGSHVETHVTTGGPGPVLVLEPVVAQPGTQATLRVTLSNPGGAA